MAGSVNKVILIGNLGKDPEVRRLNNGDPVVNLSVATSESWRDKQSGERKEKTEWHRVVIFNENIAKVAEQYLKKGSTVYIEGQRRRRPFVRRRRRRQLQLKRRQEARQRRPARKLQPGSRRRDSVLSVRNEWKHSVTRLRLRRRVSHSSHSA